VIFLRDIRYVRLGARDLEQSARFARDIPPRSTIRIIPLASRASSQSAILRVAGCLS
jgi:hypothetical protein